MLLVTRGHRAVLAACTLFMLGGCATLPPPDAGRVPSQALTDTADTALGQLARPPSGDASLTGIKPLPDPLKAYAARVLLARAAQRSLDVQYYIWHEDVTGQTLLAELIAAADRGVRVRLLLDDNGIPGLDPVLATMDAHPNIEVRLFNPFASRKHKLTGYLTDFSRLNHRMHNKSFTADNSATIVGGRNIGNEYFGAGDATLFADLDVIAFGKAARDVSGAFDTYWNSNAAYPAGPLLASVDAIPMDALKAKFAAVRASPEATDYAESIIQRFRAEELPATPDALEWVPATLVCDDPAKVAGKIDRDALMLPQLVSKMGGAKTSLDIVSPYFVPGDEGTAGLATIARSGIATRIVTNSLVATDTAAVHAGYFRRRDDLLKAGVKLYEMRPDPELLKMDKAEQKAEKKAEKKARKSLVVFSSSKSSLHAKTFAIDRQRIFVGSFNFDQRSLNLNTEMGLLIDSPQLAGGLATLLDRNLARGAWEVRLQEDGHGVRWIESSEQGEKVLTREPHTGFFKRVGVRMMSWLPIEWML